MLYLFIMNFSDDQYSSDDESNEEVKNKNLISITINGNPILKKAIVKTKGFITDNTRLLVLTKDSLYIYESENDLICQKDAKRKFLIDKFHFALKDKKLKVLSDPTKIHELSIQDIKNVDASSDCSNTNTFEKKSTSYKSNELQFTCTVENPQDLKVEKKITFNIKEIAEDFYNKIMELREKKSEFIKSENIKEKMKQNTKNKNCNESVNTIKELEKNNFSRMNKTIDSEMMFNNSSLISINNSQSHRFNHNEYQKLNPNDPNKLKSSSNIYSINNTLDEKRKVKNVEMELDKIKSKNKLTKENFQKKAKLKDNNNSSINKTQNDADEFELSNECNTIGDSNIKLAKKLPNKMEIPFDMHSINSKNSINNSNIYIINKNVRNDFPLKDISGLTSNEQINYSKIDQDNYNSIDNHQYTETEINEANSILKEISINDNDLRKKECIISDKLICDEISKTNIILSNKKQPTQSRGRINHSEEKLSGKKNISNYNKTSNNSKIGDFTIVVNTDNLEQPLIKNIKNPKTEFTKGLFTKKSPPKSKSNNKYSTNLSNENIDGRFQNIVTLAFLTQDDKRVLCAKNTIPVEKNTSRTTINDKDINNISISEKTILSHLSINENSNKVESVKSLINANFVTSNIKQSTEKENSSLNISKSVLSNSQIDKKSLYKQTKQMDSYYKSVRSSLLDFINVSCNDLKHQTDSEIENSIIHSKVINQINKKKDNSFLIKSMISNSRTIDDDMILSMPFKKDPINNNLEEFKIKNSNVSNLDKYENIIKNNTMTSLISKNKDSLDVNNKTSQINNKLNVTDKVNDSIDLTNQKSFEIVFNNEENQGLKELSTDRFENIKTEESKILDKFQQKYLEIIEEYINNYYNLKYLVSNDFYGEQRNEYSINETLIKSENKVKVHSSLPYYSTCAKKLKELFFSKDASFYVKNKLTYDQQFDIFQFIMQNFVKILYSNKILNFDNKISSASDMIYKERYYEIVSSDMIYYEKIFLTYVKETGNLLKKNGSIEKIRLLINAFDEMKADLKKVRNKIEMITT